MNNTYKRFIPLIHQQTFDSLSLYQMDHLPMLFVFFPTHHLKPKLNFINLIN
jgi:hypothetical protein